LRWVPPPGALGAAIGAIAIGTAATSTSTTTTISIGTTILIGISVAREEVNGSTMRSTGEMPLMGIGKPRISLAVRLAARVAGRRVLGLELAQVVAPELERGLVAVELVLVPVVAVPVPDHPRARLAVALRTKSVTAAHHHGLVPRLAVEDLAAVAETTHEPAAIEAGAAWAAAVTVAAAAALDIAVVVAAVVVAPELAVVVAEDAAAEAEEAADVAAEDAGGNQLTNQ
jgi:hypothetical protein